MLILRPAIVLFVLLTVLTGVIYPAIVTGVAKVAFPVCAGGSVIVRDGKAIGSELIAQPFTAPGYFWPRPSAANYDASSASGSNLGPSNPALVEAVTARIVTLKAGGGNAGLPVPANLVTASASGLDPHISFEAARYQVARIAKARGVAETDIEKFLNASVEEAMLGVLGEKRVNVLMLNLKLDHPGEPSGTSRADTGWLRARGFLPESN